MVKRDDDRPTLVALVDPTLCVSCGICAGSCAPMGIGPPGRTGRDQLVALRDRIIPAVAAGSSPAVVAVCCAQAPASHVAALRERGAYVHFVSCVGNLHSSVVERLVREGVSGVIVCGCPPRDCVNREGPKWLTERLYNDREAELQPRVDRRRVRTAILAVGDLRGTVEAFEAFARDLALLDQPVRDSDADLEVPCEQVPLDEVPA